jgi:hypothetical protein
MKIVDHPVSIERAFSTKPFLLFFILIDIDRHVIIITVGSQLQHKLSRIQDSVSVGTWDWFI